MWQTKLEFLRPGFQTTIQDLGRAGSQSSGVPVGGAMDTRSMIIANRLAGNSDNNPVLEIALMGPKIKTTGDTYLAVTGAEIEIKINNESLAMYETLHVPSDSIIDLSKIKNGARSYLAINGEWKVDHWLDSCSPVPIIDLKSLGSNQIKKNSKLLIKTQKLVHKKSYPKNLRPNFDLLETIRIMRGPEYRHLSPDNKTYLSNSDFTVHKNSNRMAVSMVECIPNFNDQKELISSANLVGTIQLTKQGQPLILMQDGGTTGGYPRIANVISVDLPKIAQLKAGQKINFQLIDIDFAVSEIKKEKELLNSIL